MTRKFSIHFQRRSTLLTTSKIELNAQGCQLWNLTHIDVVSKCCIISVMRIRWWNRKQQRRIKSGHTQTCPYNGSLHILWHKREVLHHPLSGDVTHRSQSATVTCMFVHKMKNWHVWACRFATQSLTSWGTGGVFAYRIKTWHSFSPQLERCGDQIKVASYL